MEAHSRYRQVIMSVLSDLAEASAQGEVPAAFAWTGLASAFRQAGFAEVLRRAPTRPIMRYVMRDA